MLRIFWVSAGKANIRMLTATARVSFTAKGGVYSIMFPTGGEWHQTIMPVGPYHPFCLPFLDAGKFAYISSFLHLHVNNMLDFCLPCRNTYSTIYSISILYMEISVKEQVNQK